MSNLIGEGTIWQALCQLWLFAGSVIFKFEHVLSPSLGNLCVWCRVINAFITVETII